MTSLGLKPTGDRMKQLQPVLAFGALTFLLLGLVPLMDLLVATGGDNLVDVAARASEETGLVWTSNLLVVLRMAVAEPALLSLLVGSTVPTLATVVTLAFVKRPGKWRALFGRLHPLRGIPARSALVVYGLIFLILVPSLVLVLAIRQSTGANYTGSLATLNLAAVTLIVTAAFLDQGALLEELGWRGFAVPEMQRVLGSPLAAALLIGIFWGLWHLPRDITTGVIARLGVGQYAALYLPSFLLGTVAVSVIASYFMNRLGGSVIPAMMVHGITNDGVGISGSASIVEALTPFHQFTKNGVLALVAVAIVLVAGPLLGRRPGNLHG